MTKRISLEDWEERKRAPLQEPQRWVNTHETREAWLQAAIRLFKSIFEEVGAPLHNKIRVSIGFPSTGRASKRIGECWSEKASADQHAEIWIKPDRADAKAVLDVLAHELVHAAVGCDKQHGAEFKRVALAIGLEGRMRSALPGPTLSAKIMIFVEQLGPFPYAPLSMLTSGTKKQTTRNLLIECKFCDYKLRGSQKAIDMGVPNCPCCERPMTVKGGASGKND